MYRVLFTCPEKRRVCPEQTPFGLTGRLSAFFLSGKAGRHSRKGVSQNKKEFGFSSWGSADFWFGFG
jgi:hypothetical protein